MQNTNRNLRFQGLTTGSVVISYWETHLQDTPHSPLVLIHTDDVSSLLFLHSYFTDTNSRGLSAGAKDATPAKIPVGVNMTQM